MTSNKTNDKQKLDCDGDGLFTGGRAENVREENWCSLRDLPVIGLTGPDQTSGLAGGFDFGIVPSPCCSCYSLLIFFGQNMLNLFKLSAK